MSEQVEKIGRVSSASVEKHTKKSWAQWLKILNQAGAAHWEHKETAAFLKKKYKLSVWWMHVVAGGYEIHIGKRIEGRNAKGLFTLTATKSMPQDRKIIWKLLNSPEGIECWLQPLSKFQLKVGETYETDGGIYGEVRTMKVFQRARMTWQESDWAKPSVVNIHLVHRPKNKSLLAVTHENLMTNRLKEQMRVHWRDVLEKMAKMAEA